jgi:hypothetical protein
MKNIIRLVICTSVALLIGNSEFGSQSTTQTTTTSMQTTAATQRTSPQIQTRIVFVPESTISTVSREFLGTSAVIYKDNFDSCTIDLRTREASISTKSSPKTPNKDLEISPRSPNSDSPPTSPNYRGLYLAFERLAEGLTEQRARNLIEYQRTHLEHHVEISPRKTATPSTSSPSPTPPSSQRSMMYSPRSPSGHNAIFRRNFDDTSPEPMTLTCAATCSLLLAKASESNTHTMAAAAQSSSSQSSSSQTSSAAKETLPQ